MPVDESGRLVAGSVVLTDRREKEVEFFNFGGTVERITTESALVYAFDSPAPILGLTAAGNTVSDQLAFETEGILGELEEQYEERYGRAFPKRLAEIDPVSLYVAIVNSILTRYEEAPRLEEAFHGLYDALREEKSRLQRRRVCGQGVSRWQRSLSWRTFEGWRQGQRWRLAPPRDNGASEGPRARASLRLDLRLGRCQACR
jgi:hypothetical protein